MFEILKARSYGLRRFQSKTSSLVFKFVAIFNWIFRFHLSGQEDFFVWFLRTYYFDFRVNYLHNREVERPCNWKSEHAFTSYKNRLANYRKSQCWQAQKQKKWFINMKFVTISECFWVGVKGYNYCHTNYVISWHSKFAESASFM